jgi:hypothetical protein
MFYSASFWSNSFSRVVGYVHKIQKCGWKLYACPQRRNRFDAEKRIVT